MSERTPREALDAAREWLTSAQDHASSAESAQLDVLSAILYSVPKEAVDRDLEDRLRAANGTAEMLRAQIARLLKVQERFEVKVAALTSERKEIIAAISDASPLERTAFESDAAYVRRSLYHICGRSLRRRAADALERLARRIA